MSYIKKSISINQAFFPTGNSLDDAMDDNPISLDNNDDEYVVGGSQTRYDSDEDEYMPGRTSRTSAKRAANQSQSGRAGKSLSNLLLWKSILWRFNAPNRTQICTSAAATAAAEL